MHRITGYIIDAVQIILQLHTTDQLRIGTREDLYLDIIMYNE